MHIPRRHPPRWLYLALCLFVIIPLGLASRRYGASLPGWFATYGGDTLWALNLFFFLRFLSPSASLLPVSGLCLGLSFGVEISQLFHPPWLDAIRRTTLGALTLGFGFLWSDLVCYTVGTLIGTGADLFIRWTGAFRMTITPTIEILHHKNEPNHHPPTSEKTDPERT